MPPKKSNIKMMRMKELTAAAGVPRGTIQFYIKEGLIPKPIKQSANSAFYTEEHLNDILLIKELQSKRFLPLSVIKEVMMGGGGKLSVNEISTLVELDGKVFSNIEEIPELKPLTAKQLSKQTGISLEDIKILEDMGIFTPIKKGTKKLYGEDDIRFAECRVKAIQVGLTPGLGFHIGFAKIHKEFIRKLVDEESKVFLRLLTGKLEIEKIAEILEAVTPIINTMLGIMHKKEIENTIKWYVLNSKAEGELPDREKGE
ncbi:MAG: MerR family transcriptional regulator [Desulfobacteraceae bacterium]|nr:MerR family transcriptional regulator [Desulfobacteraceae bacterium]MBC2757322.1 MerR family transcriptional regulator [Desulfobacteraceae bacterium]